MQDEMMDGDRPDLAEMRRAYEEDARRRQLKPKWFIALVVLWLVIWSFVGTSGLLPRPLWPVILGLLVISEFAIAIFGPRNGQSKMW